jgi:hypothetical protein
MFEGRVLALDLASVTGYAYGVPGSIPQCGHLRFSKPGSSRAQTYRAFREWLDSAWGRKIPDIIVYELPMHPLHVRGKTTFETTKLLIGLAEHLEEWSYEKAELREATVGQVRSHFIGRNMNGVIAKRETFERCKILGWPVETKDESDACALWHYQCAWLNPKLSALPFKVLPLFKR